MDTLQPKHFIARLKGDASRHSDYAKTLQIYASDLDYAVIVMTVAEPKFSSVVLDKYLVVCAYGDVKPLLVLNKCDLAGEVPEMLGYYTNKLQIGLVKTSVPNGTGIAELGQLLAGKRVVFLGKSGIGKSSLINSLRGTTEIKTADVSEKFGEGRHTTTSTTEYSLANGAVVIDTPGLRNLDISHIDPVLLRELYIGFFALQPECKFRDCVHVNEIGCAVKAAVESGNIPQERYENYLKIART